MRSAAEIIKEKFPDIFIQSCQVQGDEIVKIRPEGIAPVALFLKSEPQLYFNVLMDIAGVDYLGEEPRFEVVYHFYSLPRHTRLRVKVRVKEEAPEVDTLSGIWKNADWYEREVWDMFGIRFRGHSNLKRILLYEGFEGHPLRKDYPYRKRQPLIGPMN